MPDHDSRKREALETAIAAAISRRDIPPRVILTVLTHALAMMIEEAPFSRAEKHELASFLAEQLHEAADA